jgi:uncharacterized repeat protein (TIGR01451 family)
VGNVYGPYSFTATGSAPIGFSLNSGALPTGLSLSTAGVLSGTPTATGTFAFTVRAANGTSPDAVTPTRTIIVNPATNSADLRVSLDAPATAHRHDVITYVLTVRNLGPSSASSVRVNLFTSEGSEIISSTPSAGVNHGHLNWSLPSLAAGAEARFEIRVRVGRRSASAFGAAYATTPDPVFNNNFNWSVTLV